jgi:hypothetical protein
VGACLKRGKLRYAELVENMRAESWFCYRLDLDATAIEHWHFGYFGGHENLMSLADPDIRNTWAHPTEALIVALYGDQFKLADLEVQQALAALRFYTGDLDGVMGPLAREAIGAFQRAWGLPDDGVAGPRTRRVLAVVAAEISLATVTA